MAGPWEQYQTQPTAPEVGPWTAYAGQGQGQGEHGYAPAPPEPVESDTGPFDPVEPSYPDYVQRPLTLPEAVTGAAMVDDYGRPIGATPAAPEPVRRVAAAAGEGWRDTPSIMTPYGEDVINKMGPLGRQIINPAIKVLNTPVAALNALIYGGAETANQVTGDPRAGRDFMAAVNTLPFIQAGRLPGPRAPAPEPAIAARPQYVSERFAPDVSELDPYHAIDALIRHDIQENPPAAPPRVNPNMKGFDEETAARPAPSPAPEAPPPPPTDTTRYQAPDRGAANQGTDQVAAPVPDPAMTGGAAGADVTRDPTLGRSRREQAGSQADMEMADLMRTPQPGDARDIIPGATQTKAEIELHPDVSREAKGLRQEFREGFNEHEKENNEIYHKHIDDIAPLREQTATEKDKREARWEQDEKTSFGPTRVGEQVSAKDVVDHMREVLADPIEESNSYLKKAFQPFIDQLTDADGNPRDMGAKQLYGVRKEMARRVKDMATNPDLAHVRSQFHDLLEVTDDSIVSGAPKYRTMMDNYRQASIGINEAERLQDIRLKITNGSDRVITFGALDRYMKALWAERHGPNPYATAKDIRPETWDKLVQLHERLARSASADELAKTKGSDTTQLMMEMMRKGAIGVAHLAAAKFTGGLGNIAIPYITKQLSAARTRKQIAAHLNPDLGNYPPIVP